MNFMEKMAMEFLRPQGSLAGRLVGAHLTVTSCFQCRKCSAGCPLSFAMDLFPDQVIRLALLGQEDRVLGSRTIWVCSGCETCTSRCPNGIDIAGVMDWLKEEAASRNQAVEPEVATFHRLFLESIRASGGRLGETRLLRRFSFYKMRHRPDFAELKGNLKLGWKLWKRHRMRLTGPPALRGKAEINEIFRKAAW
jgi:heterodisulfide reductase subunit C2